MSVATVPCACDRERGENTPRPSSPCAKDILSREEELTLTAMRDLRREARDLKEELQRIEGKDRLMIRQRYLEMALASLRERFREHQEELRRANRQKHIRLGHLDPEEL